MRLPANQLVGLGRPDDTTVRKIAVSIRVIERRAGCEKPLLDFVVTEGQTAGTFQLPLTQMLPLQRVPTVRRAFLRSDNKFNS
jgi:hypothetical protein